MASRAKVFEYLELLTCYIYTGPLNSLPHHERFLHTFAVATDCQISREKEEVFVASVVSAEEHRNLKITRMDLAISECETTMIQDS